MEQSKNKEITEEWAYQVIAATEIAMDKAISTPSLIPQLLVELQKNSPDILEAVISLVKEEHRQEVAQLIRSVVRLNAVCLKKIQRMAQSR